MVAGINIAFIRAAFLTAFNRKHWMFEIAPTFP